MLISFKLVSLILSLVTFSCVPLWLILKQHFLVLVWSSENLFQCNFSDLNRYAYSEEASEDFDKDDTTLTLIKPSPTPSKDFRAPEARTVQGSNGVSNGDVEEDKTE